jgi:hypothetical protein
MLDGGKMIQELIIQAPMNDRLRQVFLEMTINDKAYLAAINPNNAIEIINVRLSLENTLLTLLRLQSLAYGFETFAWRQKAKLSRLLTVFKEQPDTDKCIFWVKMRRGQEND